MGRSAARQTPSRPGQACRVSGMGGYGDWGSWGSRPFNTLGLSADPWSTAPGKILRFHTVGRSAARQTPKQAGPGLLGGLVWGAMGTSGGSSPLKLNGRSTGEAYLHSAHPQSTTLDTITSTEIRCNCQGSGRHISGAASTLHYHPPPPVRA